MAAFSLLDWLIRATSFFNCILSLWLGLTVLLNAERRTWGAWVAGGGLVLNGAFFAVHSAIVARDMGTIGVELALWWPMTLFPFVGLPYLWYLVMAWYSGQLRTSRGRWALGVASAAGLGALALIGLKLRAATVPDPAQGSFMLIGTLPASALIFPIYSVLCIGLALDAVRRPYTPERFMGDAARERARPWLVATSLALLAVSLVAGSGLYWLLHGLGLAEIELFSLTTLTTLKALDVMVAVLVALAIMFVGQAAVSYEVFTGHVLPRRGLYRQWRQALLASAVFGALVAASLGLPMGPVDALVVAMLLLALTLAVQGRRAYAERERTTDTLRALMESDRLYDRMTHPEETESVANSFAILCRDVLGAEAGYLIPLGPMAALAGTPVQYPDTSSPVVLDGLLDQWDARASAGDAVTGGFAPSDRDAICRPLDPDRHGGARWAIPLGADRPSSGVLLLGRKTDGSLYAEEEIGLARATGERIVEARASAELARRLIAIQRGRVAESQVVDRQTRRLLHDEVLPRLHTIILAMEDEALRRDLADLHRLISDELQSIVPALSGRAARDGLIPALRHLVEVELTGSFERATLAIAGGAGEVANTIPELSREVAYGAVREAMRNAARHGRGDSPIRPLHLSVALEEAAGLRIVIADDGVGFVSSRDTSAVGKGLVLHTTMMAVVGGSFEIDSTPGSGTRAVVTVPLATEAAAARTNRPTV
jgi:signal transduction histidine kinase